jgi:hypothetical protein
VWQKSPKAVRRQTSSEEYWQLILQTADFTNKEEKYLINSLGNKLKNEHDLYIKYMCHP